MSVESYTNGPVVIVPPQGRLDTNSAPEVEKALTDHIERGEQKIVLDLSGLEYISSIGLRVILKAAMAMTRNGGQMALSGGERPNPPGAPIEWGDDDEPLDRGRSLPHRVRRPLMIDKLIPA